MGMMNTRINKKTGEIIAPTSRPVVDCSKDKGKTKQTFKDQVDPNKMAETFKRSGLLPNLREGELRYVDVSEVGDLHTALTRVREAERAFLNLPSKIRERFGGDPAQMIAFLQDPKNKKEGQELGLLKPDPEKKHSGAKEPAGAEPPRSGAPAGGAQEPPKAPPAA